jgi:hypothetical protein
MFAMLVACGNGSSSDPTGSGTTSPSSSPSASTPASSTATTIANSLGIAIHGTAYGRLESSGETGAWVFEQGPCYSGELDGYFGAQAEAQAGDGIGIRFLKDPLKGWAMKVNVPDTCKGSARCQAVIFMPDQCKTFDVDIALDTTHGRRVKWYGGTVAVDCTIGKTHISGELTLHACRN